MGWLRRRGRGAGRRGPREIEAAARARRARDHLARKRERERSRLARERSRVERKRDRGPSGSPGARRLRLLAPVAFLAALIAGQRLAAPVVESLLLRTTPLERVAVQGARALSPEAIVAGVGAGALAGTTLDRVDPAAMRDALAAEPWIDSARVLRLPSGTLVVGVVERRAIARWRLGEATTLVDPTGAPFPGDLAPAGPLPLVAGEAAPAEALPGEALAILAALDGHPRLRADAASFTLHLPAAEARSEPAAAAAMPERPGYVLELGRDGPRALLGRRLFDQRLARLAALLDEDEATVRTARLIDLRYADRAVLQTGPASG